MELHANEMKRPAPVPATVLPAETDSLSPSNSKRPRVWEPNGSELSTNVIPDCVATILDVLNTDCWRLVLDYVSVRDVVRSERVSRGWQRVVRDYLAGVHKYQIVHMYDDYTLWRLRAWSISSTKYRMIHLTKSELFENMIQKMGPFFEAIFASFVNKERLEAIAVNCPNLKKIKIQLAVAKPRTENLHFEVFNNCKHLKQLSLNLFNQGDDSSLKEIVAIETLEELGIIKQDRVTGSFITNLRTNLRSLIFVQCPSLLIDHIRSVADRLTGLTRLELNCNSISTLRNVHLLLDETPNLESLCLADYLYRVRSHQLIELGNEVPMAIGRLSRLKEVCFWRNMAVTNEWLEIVARGCSALRSVDVGRTRVGARGLLALCRACPDLAKLVVCTPFIKEEELEPCVRYCRALELLDVSYCYRLKESLPARLSWPRTRPLRLRMFGVVREKIEVHYDGITLLWDRPRHSSWPD